MWGILGKNETRSCRYVQETKDNADWQPSKRMQAYGTKAPTQEKCVGEERKDAAWRQLSGGGVAVRRL